MLFPGGLIEDGVVGDLQHLAGELELHAPLAVGIHEDLADLLVGGAGDLGHHLHHDHVDAHAGEVAGHFQTDDAAAHAHQLFG